MSKIARLTTHNSRPSVSFYDDTYSHCMSPSWYAITCQCCSCNYKHFLNPNSSLLSKCGTSFEASAETDVRNEREAVGI